MAHWHDIDSARDLWDDAPLDDDELTELLEVAADAVVSFAPALVVAVAPGDHEGVIPVAWRRAQLMQARNIHNADLVTPGGEVGADGFVRTIHPLDWQIKQILRPKKGAPRARRR